jgi:acyl dehydratase
MTTDNKNMAEFEVFKPGEELGVSPWVRVDQDMISGFGHITLDPDPMHIDPEYAVQNGPYGGTIAFGFLTMSLLTHLLHAAIGDAKGQDRFKTGHFLNYGFDRMRLVSPVRVNSNIRGRFKTLDAQTDEKGRLLVKFGCEIEIEGQERPALVGEWLAIWVSE